MSFMGRGDFPSMGNGNENGNIDGNENRNGDSSGSGAGSILGWLSGRNLFYLFFRGYYYKVSLDNTYVIMQMIMTFIIAIVAIISFVTTYKSDIVDPIESTKSMFMNTYLIVIAVFLLLTFIINYSAKNEVSLIKRLIVFFMISVITMLAFFGVKLNLDKTYTETKFGQIFSEQNVGNSKDESKSVISIELLGVSMKTEREYYVDECVKLYNIFSVKTYSVLGMHLLLNILLVYQISKVSKIQGKKETMNKDDIILFDEEENVKF